MATIKGKEEKNWIKAAPSSLGQVNLKPGESEVYNATWEYDASHIIKENFTELIKPTRIRIIYTTSDGEEAVRLYLDGAPYPSVIPPANPPGR